MSTSRDRAAPRLADEAQTLHLNAPASLQAYLEELAVAPLYNLPVTLTDFIGLGGAGKTRLAPADAGRRSFMKNDTPRTLWGLGMTLPEMIRFKCNRSASLPPGQNRVE